MHRLLPFVFAFVSLSLGCGSVAPPAPARSPTVALSKAPAAPLPVADDAPPLHAMTEADALYRDQLATQGRELPFSTDRQVAALQQAVMLYKQFIERAGDDPRYAEAVQRARARIEDAEAARIFLVEQPPGP